MEVHRSAHKHGIDDATITNAVEHALVIVDLEPDSDPPRVLAIGPDQAGDLLEVIWLEFPDRVPIVIYAVRLRRTFYDLLPREEDDS